MLTWPSGCITPQENPLFEAGAAVPFARRLWEEEMLNNTTFAPQTNFSPFSEDYLKRLAAGDPEMEQHFTDYFSALLRIKLRMRLCSSEAIEDVRQETFLRVLEALRSGRLHYADRLGAFVNSVCNNVLLETYREKNKHRPAPQDTREPADPRVSPESEAVTRERKEIVLRILDKLPAKDCELLRMIFLEERDKADICRSMKVNQEYLRVLVFRAKIRFRTALEKFSPGALTPKERSAVVLNGGIRRPWPDHVHAPLPRYRRGRARIART